MNLKIAFVPIVLATALLFGACKKELNPSDPGNLVAKTVDQDPTLPSIHINGTQLHAETFGHPDSAIVIVLHGGPGNDYRSMLKCKDLVDHGYFMVFYDQRGSGLSARHPMETYSKQIMFDDLGAIIQKFKKRPEQKVFLLGHSWGAMLATAYINLYPDQITGTILAEPGGFTWEVAKEFIKKTRAIDPFSEEASDAFYFDQIFTGKEDQHEILDYKHQLLASGELVPGNNSGIEGPYPFWRKGAVCAHAFAEIAKNEGFDFTQNLSEYQTKVLFIYSERNNAYTDDHALLVSSAYPNVQLEKINGTGHEMFWFAWNKVQPLVLNYLNNLK